MNMATIISVAVVILLVIWLRTKSMRKPIKGKGIKLLLPIIIFIVFIPLVTLQLLSKGGTSAQTGTFPSMMEMVVALLLGVVLSIPMVLTTNYELRDDNQIYAKKSTAFTYALVGLILIRLALKDYFSSIDPVSLSLLSMILAFGYVGVWRIVSFVKFRKVLGQKGPEKS